MPPPGGARCRTGGAGPAWFAFARILRRTLRHHRRDDRQGQLVRGL